MYINRYVWTGLQIKSISVGQVQNSLKASVLDYVVICGHFKKLYGIACRLYGLVSSQHIASVVR